MALGSAPQRNIADGASGGATLMSHHFGGSHAEVIPQSEAIIEARGRGKALTTTKAARKAPRPVREPTKRRATLPSSPAQAGGVVSAAAGANKRANKQTKLLDLLRRPAGATIAALSNASGWQQHSVRGFLAGVVRKKLGLELVSAVEADQRIYRIIAAKQA